MFRSRDGIIAGVCEGIAVAHGCDPWMIRTIFILLILFFGMFPVWAYLVLWIFYSRGR